MIFITKVTSVAAKLSPIAQCAVCPKQLKLQKKTKAKKEHIEKFILVFLCCDIRGRDSQKAIRYSTSKFYL